MENDDLLQDFVVESNEHLADIESELLAIEEQGDDFDADLVNKVFRALHSIKGASGFLGLERICELSHSMENVLNAIRNHELSVSSPIVDALLKSSDRLKSLFEDIGQSNDADVAALVGVLESLQLGGEPPAAAPEPEAVPEPESAPAPEAVPNPIAQAVPEPAPAESTAPANVAPSASTEPKPQAVAEHKASAKPAEKAPSSGKSSSSSATVRVTVSVLDRLMNLAGELVLGRNQLVQILGSEERVGIESVGSRIDQITSELQEAIMETRMQPVGNVFAKFPRVVRDLSASLGKDVSLVTEGNDVELDKTIIEAISDPLTHLVRNSVDHGVESPDDRAARGKPRQGTVVLRAFHDGGTVNITISDDGAGIDVEVLKAKAVAKGLITTERAGEISDRDARHLIFHPGFSTKEQVTDISGRGVGMDVVQTNLEKLGGTIEVDSELGTGTTIAVKLPLTLAIIPALIVKSDRESYAIPQLNIIELVRVKEGDGQTRIEKLKGAEVLRLRGHLLPLVRLDETLDEGRTDRKDTREEIDESTDAEEQVSALIEGRAKGTTNVIVVAAGKLRYGLVVGELRDSEEIVVKPLGRHIKDAPCFSGATILGDGHIALILDVAGIGAHRKLESRGADEPVVEDQLEQNGGSKHSVILFRGHSEELFAVNSGLVSRIDRVKTEDLVVVGGVEGVQGPDRLLPILRLEHLISARPWEASAMAYVLVFEVGGRELGLIVPSLEDIRDVSTEIDGVTMSQPGVAGSLTLDGTEMRLIDIHELAELAFPGWFEEFRREREERRTQRAALEASASHVAPEAQPQAPASTTAEAPTEVQPAAPEPSPVPAASEDPSYILLAEDSGFFRKKVKAYIQAAGYQVLDYEDGKLAWDALCEERHDFRLVVTDVEMPNMSGLELTAAIRADARFSHLPVIALTSLASEEDIRRGRDVGVSDYQVKMDRDRLVDAVDGLWNGAGVPASQ